MRAAGDIIGQRFGRLVVVERAGKDRKGTLWLCRCDCGNLKVLPTKVLNSGQARSCGCQVGRQVKDLTGQRFGRLVVIGRGEKEFINPREHCAVWRCRCDCGREVVVRGYCLTGGHTRSCGCLRSKLLKQAIGWEQGKEAAGHDEG